MTSNLQWDSHIALISSKAYKKLGLLRHSFSSAVHINAKRSLYLSLIRSQLVYCSQIWRPYLLTDIILLERVQRRAIKLILNDYSSNQVALSEWLWMVHIVTNLTTAKEAILEIIEQGDDAGPGNPIYLDSGDYAHFYKFKEIHCQHQSVKHGTKYTFQWAQHYTFNPNGVWLMQDNPSKASLGTANIYNTTRVLNQLFWKLAGGVW